MPTRSGDAGRAIVRACRTASASVLAATVLVASGPDPAAGEGRLAPLLGFCAPPFVPPCVDQVAEHPDRREACKAQMSRYVGTVFDYRACLIREVERAIRESNETIAAFRHALGHDQR